MADQPPASWQPPARKLARTMLGLGSPYTAQANAERKVTMWNKLSAAEKDAARAQNRAGANAAMAAATDARKLETFKRLYVVPITAALANFANVALKFRVGAQETYTAENAQAAVDAAAPAAGAAGAFPPVQNAEATSSAAAEQAAKLAANKTELKIPGNENKLFNVLLRQDAIVQLRRALAGVDFDSNLNGVRNFRTNAFPFDATADGNARFLELLKCHYKTPDVLDCTAENQAWFAYMTKAEPTDLCLSSIIQGLGDGFKAGPVLCAALAEAADAQAPDAAAAQIGGYSRKYRQSRHSRRKNRGQSHRGSRGSRGSRRH